MKIYIDDPCARGKGLEEAQINSDKTIRFDNGISEYLIKFLDEGGLEIMKFCINRASSAHSDTIHVIPYSLLGDIKMGDRISISFVNGDEKGVVLFSHWDGENLLKTVDEYLEDLVTEIKQSKEERTRLSGCPLAW